MKDPNLNKIIPQHSRNNEIWFLPHFPNHFQKSLRNAQPIGQEEQRQLQIKAIRPSPINQSHRFRTIDLNRSVSGYYRWPQFADRGPASLRIYHHYGQVYVGRCQGTEKLTKLGRRGKRADSNNPVTALYRTKTMIGSESYSLCIGSLDRGSLVDALSQTNRPSRTDTNQHSYHNHLLFI